MPILHALRVAGNMTWQVTWSLILGFALSAVIEALVKKSTIARLLPDDRPRSLATASVLGAASSSCSYAAVALARSLVRKGADFTAAMAFQFASTNLVIELGLIMALILGWQFTLGEFVGGPLMILFLALLIGPVVAVVTFVCSIGNAPLAAVLWNGGISFGGVVSFIFADLIIIPLLLIYAKYYGRRMAWFLFATFYATMAAAGYVIELVFAPLGLVPGGERNANVGDDGISWNYTSWLNIAFLLLAAVLLIRFFRTGGRQMLAMMGGAPDDMAHGEHEHAPRGHH